LEGDTYEEAFADVKSVIAFHIEPFSEEAHGKDNRVARGF
jgi:predicted RNase H-like HicB family nuclease